MVVGDYHYQSLFLQVEVGVETLALMEDWEEHWREHSRIDHC